jgi:hypothetical protein
MVWDSLPISLYMFGFSRYGLFDALVAIIFGVGLAYNCIRGLRSREGMFDEANSNYMTLAQWAGIVLGLGGLAWGCMTLYRYLELL